MLYTKKFVFTVSLCAMLAVNPVLAVTDSVEAKAGAKSGTPGVVSEVYSDWAGRATSGIAGVTYVNSAVDAAGNAAQWAENHAAAAAQSAKSAAESAAQAASKVSIDQGDDNIYKAMVTDDAGSVYAGYVAPAMIASPGDSLQTGLAGLSIVSDGVGYARWGQASEYGIADGAVKTNKIADGAVTADKIANGAVTPGKIRGIESYTGFLASHGLETSWRLVETNDIADSAVTAQKITSSGQSGVLFSDGGVSSWRMIGSDMLETRAVTAGNIWSPDGFTSGVLHVDGSGMSKWGLIYADDIANGAVTTIKIANAAVTTNKIAAGAVTASGIAAGAVTTSGIADGAVDVYKIANNAVTTNKIADDAVTLGKIASRAVPAASMFSSGESAGVPLVTDGNDSAKWGQVGSAGIANGAVTIDKIADGGKIDNTNSYSGFVLWSDSDGNVSWKTADSEVLAFDAVTASRIADSAVTADKIADSAVTADKLSAGIPSGSSTTGFLAYYGSNGRMVWRRAQTDDIASSAVRAEKIADGAVVSGKIANGAVTTDNIASGAVTIEKTAGVVGMVPVGAEGATTYGSFWIE